MDARDTPRLTRPTGLCDRIALALIVMAWGIQAIVTQSLLLREALVLMFGSELAWGIVLFAWLLGVAVGATVSGEAAARLRTADLALVSVLLALSVVSCAELWVFRGARGWLGVEPGAVFPLSKTAVAAMLFIPPAGALVGAAFPLACRLAEGGGSVAPGDPVLRAAGFNRRDVSGVRKSARGDARGSLATVYAWEAAGSLIGGAAFSFWAVEHLSPIETALACGALVTAAAGGYLAVVTRRRLAAAGLGAVALAVAAASVFWGASLNEQLVQRRWQDVAAGYELCAEIETKYQNLAVGRRAEQYTLYSDGHVSIDFPDPYTFVPLAHFWMCQHRSPRNVLVLGGGAEGLLAEILKHPVEHVDYVEPDPKQIELIAPYLPEGDRRALASRRLTVHHVDARYYVKTQRDRFDLVIARLPEPISALKARFFTDEFFAELRRAMRPDAVLCMTAVATPANLTAMAAEYLASIDATLRRHFQHVTIGWGNPAHVLAATQAGLITTDPATLAARYDERGVRSELFHPLWFEGATDWLDPDKVRQRAAEIRAAPSPAISTDLRPLIYMQRLALWERMTGGPSAGVIERLRAVSLPALVIVLAATAAATLVGCRLRYGRAGWANLFARALPEPPEVPHGQAAFAHATHGVCCSGWLAHGAIILAVATTGFATMALSIVFLFAFQNLYGYVYQRIGWIIAIFMAGLVVGCGTAALRVASPPRGRRRIPVALRRLRSPRGVTATAMGSALSPVGPAFQPVEAIDAWAATRRTLWRRLIAVDAMLALLALAVPFVLPALGALQTTHLAFATVEWAVSILVALTGVLGGATFALAGALTFGSTPEAGAAAGVVVGADHAGACLGALLTGILLVPVFGTVATALLLAGMKITSVTLLMAGQLFNLRRARVPHPCEARVGDG